MTINGTWYELIARGLQNTLTPAPHNRVKYRWRNRIERLFNKLKNWRRVATRYALFGYRGQDVVATLEAVSRKVS